jgi:hypothetical protein
MCVVTSPASESSASVEALLRTSASSSRRPHTLLVFQSLRSPAIIFSYSEAGRRIRPSAGCTSGETRHNGSPAGTPGGVVLHLCDSYLPDRRTYLTAIRAPEIYKSTTPLLHRRPLRPASANANDPPATHRSTLARNATSRACSYGQR